MASDHRAHANAPRAYTRACIYVTTKRVSAWSCVWSERERAHRIISGISGTSGERGSGGGWWEGQSKNEGSEKDSTPLVGRRSKGDAGGSRGETGHWPVTSSASPLPCRGSFFKRIPRSLGPAGRQSVATVRTSWVRGLDNKTTIDKGRQTLARLAAIEAIRERARIDGGVLVERMIAATSARIKSLSEISNLDRQSIIYQCDVSRLYRNNGYRNLLRDYVPKLNCYSERRVLQ